MQAITQRTLHSSGYCNNAICQIRTYFNTKTFKRFAANALGNGSLTRLQIR